MNSGIYKITNKVNGKFYIGSSNNIKRRWGHHKSNLRSGTHTNYHLQNSYDKHGEDQFEFVLIEEVRRANLLAKEQEYLDEAFGGDQEIYNISRVAGSPMAGLNHTEEVKQLLSEKLSGENHPHYGKPVSEEWRRKISKSNKRFTDEQEASFRERWLSGETKGSIAKEIGVHTTTITRAIERAERFNY
jgi:group I intron endonuclease